MALPASNLDREHRKFVESPTRPNNSAIEVVGVISDADGDQLQINPDGSINVNFTVGDLSLVYNEVTAVANGATTTIINYTPTTNIKIIGIDVSGTNIAMYEILQDAAVISKKYTYIGSSLSEIFDLDGLLLSISNNIKVDVTHSRPFVGNFNATIRYIEV